MTMYFVTGTDTGAGKTYVSVQLLRRARALGKKTFGFKPIETGCTAALGPDQQLLVEAAGAWQRDSLRGLYQFKEPLAPRVAAEREGMTIDVDRCVSTARQVSATVAFTVVEGAGGWRVPLTSELDIADLARGLGAPVVVAARAGLGTINHSLLTVQAVERDGCQVGALVLSLRPEDDIRAAQQNRDEILQRWRGVVIVLGMDASVLDPLI